MLSWAWAGAAREKPINRAPRTVSSFAEFGDADHAVASLKGRTRRLSVRWGAADSAAGGMGTPPDGSPFKVKPFAGRSQRLTPRAVRMRSLYPFRFGYFRRPPTSSVLTATSPALPLPPWGELSFPPADA